VTNEDTTLIVPAPGVLDGDTDADGDALTAVLVTGPANGTLGLNPNGSFTYTPDTDFTGTDSFTYQASDGVALSNVALVQLSVGVANDAPVADNDAFATNEDTALIMGAPGVLDGDTDPDGDALTAQLVSGPTHGTLALNPDGSFTYTPGANFNGDDSFTYQANDGTEDSNVATVSLTVRPVNDAPVADDDAYATDEDTPLIVAAAQGVLNGDTDVDGDLLTAVVVTGPTNGTLGLNADGSFTYTPDANFSGVDSFTYRANDGTTDSNLATVQIAVAEVADGPVNVDDRVQVTFTGYSFNRFTNTFTTTATIKNVSSDVLDQMTLVVTSITPNTVTLQNADGVTDEGHPYKNVPLPADGLQPGESATGVRLVFHNPSRAGFTFTNDVFATIEESSPPAAFSEESLVFAGALSQDAGVGFPSTRTGFINWATPASVALDAVSEAGGGAKSQAVQTLTGIVSQSSAPAGARGSLYRLLAAASGEEPGPDSEIGAAVDDAGLRRKL
jgi:VCBS repeat-containing protein